MWVEEVLTGGQLQEHDVNVVILQLLSHHYPPRHTHTHTKLHLTLYSNNFNSWGLP